MRYHAAVFAIVLGFQVIAVQKAMGTTVASIVNADKWSVAQGTRGGKPLVIRYRDGFESHPIVTSFPLRLTVTWKFKPDQNGMPDRASGDAMGAFEDQLIPALEHDLTAVLTAVITDAGARQWILYTNSAKLCADRINGIPHTHPYPIALSFEDDADWTFLYRGILDGMRK